MAVPALLLLLLACLSVSHAEVDEVDEVDATGGRLCWVTYARTEGRPLLFGGLYDAGRCRSKYNRCQPRDDEWGKKCSFKWSGSPPAAPWGTCGTKQSSRVLEAAGKLAGGAMLGLTPCEFVRYLRGRTLWLLGDSHTKDLYRALQCFLLDFWDHSECVVSPDAAAKKLLEAQPERPGLSNCIHLLGRGGGRVCMVEVVLGTSLVDNSKVAMGGVLPLLHARLAQRQDIFLVNFGSWHRDGGPKWSTFRPSLHALGKFYQATKAEWPHLLFRESVARHPEDKARRACKAVAGYELDYATGQLNVSPAARSDKALAWELGLPLVEAVRDVLPSYGVAVVPAFNASVPLNSVHVGARWGALDCSHYCQLGVPQMWVWFLYEAMRTGQSGIQQLTAAPAPAAIASSPQPAGVVTEAGRPAAAAPAPAAAAAANASRAEAAVSPIKSGAGGGGSTSDGSSSGSSSSTAAATNLSSSSSSSTAAATNLLLEAMRASPSPAVQHSGGSSSRSHAATGPPPPPLYTRQSPAPAKGGSGGSGRRLAQSGGSSSSSSKSSPAPAASRESAQQQPQPGSGRYVCVASTLKFR